MKILTETTAAEGTVTSIGSTATERRQLDGALACVSFLVENHPNLSLIGVNEEFVETLKKLVKQVHADAPKPKTKEAAK